MDPHVLAKMSQPIHGRDSNIDDTDLAEQAPEFIDLYQLSTDIR